MSLLRVKMRWSGFQGGPGFSIFHWNDFGSGPTGWEPVQADADACVARVDTFAQAILGVLPANTTLQVMGDVEVINPENGDLEDIYTVTQPAARVPGHSAGPYSAPVGAVISWRTGVVRNGRRVHGRTFLVPCIGAVFENNGTLTSTAIATITSAATGLSTGSVNGDLTVWARPTGPGATDGSPAIVTGFTVPDMGAVLRSRRD